MMRGFRQILAPGLASAVMGLPLAVGFAVLAGVPPMVMILTSVYSALFNALLSSSRYGNGGPNTLVALMTGAALSHYAPVESSMYMGYVFALTIIIGIIQLMMAWLFIKFDPLDYVSPGVLDGVTVGAGVAFLFSAIAPSLGFATGGPEQWSGYNVYVLISHALQGRAETAAICIAGVTVGVGLILTQVKKWTRISMLVGLSAGIAIALIVFDSSSYESVGLLHAPFLATSLPDFRQVSWPILLQLVESAVVIAIVGALQTLVIAKNILHKDDTYSPTAEMLSQGSQHIFMGFFQGAPGSSSFSKSTLMRDLHGGRGALVLSALVTLFLVYGLGHWLSAIPLPALAGCMVLAALSMLAPSQYKKHYRAGKQAFVLFALTALSTIFINIQTGLFLGVALSLWMTLLAGSVPYITMREEDGNALHIRVQGSVTFISSAKLARTIRRSLPKGHGLSQVTLDISQAHLHKDGYYCLVDICLAADGANVLISASSIQQELIDLWRTDHLKLALADIQITRAD